MEKYGHIHATQNMLMETRQQFTWVEDSLQGLFISFYHVSLRDLTQGFRFGGRCLNHWVIFLAQVFISFLSFKLHILKCCLSSAAGNHQCLSLFNDSLFHAVSFIVFWDVPAILQKRRFKAVGVAQCWNVSLSCTGSCSISSTVMRVGGGNVGFRRNWFYFVIVCP